MSAQFWLRIDLDSPRRLFDKHSGGLEGRSRDQTINIQIPRSKKRIPNLMRAYSRMLDAQTMEAHQKKRLLSREENMHNVKRKKSVFLHWLSLQCKDKLIVKGRGDFTPINYHFFFSFCSFFAALFQYIFLLL